MQFREKRLLLNLIKLNLNRGTNLARIFFVETQFRHEKELEEGRPQSLVGLQPKDLVWLPIGSGSVK